METLTIREAAQRCEVSYELMRKRVDRGTIRTVKRDGVRFVPRAELERAGLWPGSQPQPADTQELATLRQQLAAAQAELVELRPLPARLEAERHARELAEASLHEQRAAATTAEARLEQAERAREEVAAAAAQERQAAEAALEPLTGSGLVSGVRALLALRRNGTPSSATERAGTPAPA